MKPIKLTESDFKKLSAGKNIKYYARDKRKNGYRFSVWVEIFKAYNRDEFYCAVFVNNQNINDCNWKPTFKNAVDEANKILATLHTALSAKQEPCEVCKEVKNLWGSPNIDINGYDYCPYCGRKLEESNGI